MIEGFSKWYDAEQKLVICAPSRLIDPDQYLICVGSLAELIVRVDTRESDAQLYDRVCRHVALLRFRIYWECGSPKEPVIEAFILAWRGDMKGDTLRRLAAAESGARQLELWQHAHTYHETVVTSLWAQATGPDHMTRVRALVRLADIYDIMPPLPDRDVSGVVYVDPADPQYL